MGAVSVSRKLCPLLLLLVLCVVSSARAEVPIAISRVVTNYLESLRNGEYDKAYNLFSRSDRDRITKDQWVESCTHRVGGQDMNIPDEMLPVLLLTMGDSVVGETTFKGEEAITTVEIKANLPLKLFLVKQGDEWLIDLQRSDQAQVSGMLAKLLEGAKRQGAGLFGAGMMGGIGMVGLMGEVMLNSGMLQRFVKSYDVRSATIEGERAEVEVVQAAVLKKNAYFRRAGGYWMFDLQRTFAPEQQPNVVADGEVGRAERGVRDRATQAQCLSNLKQIGTAMMMYAADHDNQLPAANQWCDQLEPYMTEPRILKCPTAPDLECGYVMNFKLSKVKLNEIAHPEQVVLLFESSMGGRNGNDDGKSWVQPPRHNVLNGVLYADGHTAMAKQRPDFRWQRLPAKPTPKQNP